MKRLSLLFTLLIPVLSFSQSYWGKVPAFPTECYSQGDPWIQKVDALKDELKKKTEEEESKVRSKFENMTDAEKQKMAMEMSTKYMNMSPDEIIAMQNSAMKSLEIQQAAQEAGTPIINRYNALEQAFRDEHGRELGPLVAEAQKLPDGEGTPDWAIKKGEELAKQYDVKYKALCEKYFTGQDALFKKWLAEYKQYVIDYLIPSYKSAYAASMQQYGILNADTPSAEWQGIIDYLGYYRSAFQLREQYPQKGE